MEGFVSVNKTVYAIDKTVIHVVGGPGAVADGGGTTQLFPAANGVLRVSDLLLSNVSGMYGGAISANQNSEVTLTRVKFTSNTANGFGGGIHVHTSLIELIGQQLNVQRQQCGLRRGVVRRTQLHSQVTRRKRRRLPIC